MTAGRPRKPTALHVLEGTYRKDRHGDRENEPDPANAELEAPYWLKGAGRRVWDELAPVYHRVGCLKETHVELFAHACKNLAAARRSTKNHKELLFAERVLGKFGGTPSDMTKIAIEKPDDDEFAEFLGEKAR